MLPVGGTQEIPIDVRFLAASNRAPKQAIGEERLRENLYYRLCAATIHLPPLRDRLEDLPALIDHFLTQANHDYQRQVDSIDPESRTIPAHRRTGAASRALIGVALTAAQQARTSENPTQEMQKLIKEFAQEGVSKGKLSDEQVRRISEVVIVAYENPNIGLDTMTHAVYKTCKKEIKKQDGVCVE